MAFETEVANFTTVGNAISALISPAFVEKTLYLNLVHAEDFPRDTNVIKFRKSGNLVAETLGESTAYTYSSNSELTDAAISCTAQKGVVVSKMTVEALRFGTAAADLPRLARLQAEALARLFDTTAVALHSGIANGVTAATTLTKDNILDAAYTVRSSMKGANDGGRLAGVFGYKGVNEVRKELTSISASAFSNESMLSLVGAPKANGLAGELAGVEIYEFSGLPTTGGDDIACIFHPRYCFAAGLGGEFQTDISKLNASGGFYYEISTYFFYNVVEWNDTAGCRVRSDS